MSVMSILLYYYTDYTVNIGVDSFFRRKQCMSRISVRLEKARAEKHSSGWVERANILYHADRPGDSSNATGYARSLDTTPAPTVLPPSLMANLRPSLMTTGESSSTVSTALSPGTTYVST